MTEQRICEAERFASLPDRTDKSQATGQRNQKVKLVERRKDIKEKLEGPAVTMFKTGRLEIQTTADHRDSLHGWQPR